MNSTLSKNNSCVRHPLAASMSTLLLSGALIGGAQAQLFPPVVKLADLDGKTGFRLNGVATGDHAGFSVSSVGDINDDGIDDVIIGAPGVAGDGFNNVGSSYVVFGRDPAEVGCFSSSLDLSSFDGGNGFRIDGVAPGDLAGWSVGAAGDVNGDGISDFIIGARLADPDGLFDAGSSYVVFGRNVPTGGSFPAVVKLSELDGTDGFHIAGETERGNSGISVSTAGDINGDGIDDLIIGASGLPSETDLAGTGFVVFGRDTSSQGDFPANFSLSSLDGSNGFRLEGVAPGHRTGYSVSGAGDLNGDGIDDLVIGAWGGSGSAGNSYVFFGRNTAEAGNFPATVPLSSLDGFNGFRIDGVATSDFSGLSVSSAGDINHDGISDLIIGAAGPYASTGKQGAKSYVLFGRDVAAQANFPATLNLSSLDGTNGFVIQGVPASLYAGISVSAAGDVNGDGIDDLIMGALDADPDGGNATGVSYVVFGRDVTIEGAFAATLELPTLSGFNGFRIDGVAAQDNSGKSVSTAGDINGDGIDDLIVGAYRAGSKTTSQAGSAYIVFGRGDILFANGFESQAATTTF